MSSIFEQAKEAPGHLGSAASGFGHAISDPIMGQIHAAQSIGSGVAHGVGDVASGYMHAGHDLAHDVAGGFSHGMDDIRHGHLGSGLLHMGGGLMSGIGHAAGDIAGGFAHGAGDVASGIGHGISDVVHGGIGGIKGLFGGAKELMAGAKPLMTGIGAFGMGKTAWDIFKGNPVPTMPGMPAPGKADGVASGLGAINKLLGFGSYHKDEKEKDGLDHALDKANSTLGGAKGLLKLPGKITGMEGKLFNMVEQFGAGKIPGGGLIEKISGGALKESVLAEKAMSKLGPVANFLKEGGEKLLAGPAGKFLEKEVETGALKLGGGLASKIGGKLIPGLNIAMAGISAFSSGKEAYESFKKGDVFGGVVESLHTVTNLAGAVPGIGQAISMGGDLVAGAAHWLHDGGAKKLGDMASSVGGAVASGAKAVGGAVASGAKAVGGLIGDGAHAVGSALSSGASAVGGALSSGAKAVGSLVSKLPW
jgi:hypothetical protein